MFDFLKSAPSAFSPDKKKPAAPPPAPPPPAQAGAGAPPAAKPVQAAGPRPPASPGAMEQAVGHYAEGSAPPAPPAPHAEADAAHEPGEPKKVDAKSTVSSMDKMLGSVRVGFDKPEQILDALRGKDAAEIAAMREEFKKRMGPDVNMDDWVLKQQGATKKPGNVTEAQALLTGDPVEGAAWGLDNAAGGEKADPAKLMNVLASIKDDEVRKKVLAKYGQLNPEKPLSDTIDKMKGADKDKAEALLAGDMAGAKAVDMDVARGSAANGLLGKASALRVDKDEKDTMASVLRGAESPEEREKILMAYAQRRGGPCKTPAEAADFFKKDAEKFTKDGADRDFFNALADGKKAEAAAASIELAQKGGNLDQVAKEMETPIDDKLPPEEKQKLLAEHQKKMADIQKVWAEKYGAKDKDGKPAGDPPPKEQFQDMLQQAAGGGSLAKGASSPENLRLQTVADEGQMDRYTMVQYGKLTGKPEMIKKAIEGLDAKQIQELSAQGSASGDVAGAIHETAKGRQKKDLIRDAMYGETPSNAEDALDKAHDMHDSELGKGKGLLGGAVTALSDKDEQMNRLKARADELRQKQQAGALTPEEEAEAKSLPASMGGAMKGFRADEDTTAKAVTTPVKLGAGLALKPILGPFAGVGAKALGTGLQGMLTGEWSADDAKDLGGSLLGKVTELATGSDLAGSVAETAFGLGTKKDVGLKDVLKGAAGVATGAASGAVGEKAGDFAKEHVEGLTESGLVKMAAQKGAEKAGEKVADKGLEKVTDKVFGKEAEGAEEDAKGGEAKAEGGAKKAESGVRVAGAPADAQRQASDEEQRLRQVQAQQAQAAHAPR